MTSVSSLAEFPLVYLASPHALYPDGKDCAFKDVCALAAQLISQGIQVFSPIAHSHPIAHYGDLKLDHAAWLRFDEPFMNVCAALLVAQMRGWRQSRGMDHEIQFFKAAGKPVFYLETMMMTVATEPHGFRADNPSSLEGSVSQLTSPSPENPNRMREEHGG